MNYYKVKLHNNDIDKFLYVCNKLEFNIVSVMCAKDNYIAVYKGRYKITNIDELYLMILEGE